MLKNDITYWVLAIIPVGNNINFYLKAPQSAKILVGEN